MPAHLLNLLDTKPVPTIALVVPMNQMLELIVTTLKETDLRRFEVSAQGAFQEAGVLLDGRYGRLRAAVIGPDGALYVSTSNGTDDRVLRITRDD